MKVNEPKQPTLVQPGPAATATARPPTALAVQAPNSADRVTTDEADRLNQAVSDGRRMAAAERALRLQSLAQQVRSGTYRPNVSQLAAEILEQADLDARLARHLG